MFLENKKSQKSPTNLLVHSLSTNSLFNLRAVSLGNQVALSLTNKYDATSMTRLLLFSEFKIRWDGLHHSLYRLHHRRWKTLGPSAILTLLVDPFQRKHLVERYKSTAAFSITLGPIHHANTARSCNWDCRPKTPT